MVDGEQVRTNPASFDDHFSQATLFYRSLTPVEQEHIVEAFTFELGKCLAGNPGTHAHEPCKRRSGVVRARCERARAPRPVGEAGCSQCPRRALSQITGRPGPITGRVVGVVAGPDSDLAGIARLRKALVKEGAVLRVIAETGGKLTNDGLTETVDRTLLTTRSIGYDAVVVAGGTAGLDDPKLGLLLTETNRHYKALGGWGDGAQVLSAAGIDTAAPGVVVGARATPKFVEELLTALRLHRAWDRGTAADPPADEAVEAGNS